MYYLQVQMESGIPTAEEAYNFFTLNFEPEPQDSTEKTSRKRQRQKKTAEEDGNEEGGSEAEKQENEDQVRYKQRNELLSKE